MPLVHYGSDSDTESPVSPAETKVRARPTDRASEDRPQKKRKALPSLPDSYALATRDDPSQHQGRSRSRPFVDGDYNAHIYVSLEIDTGLRRVLDRLLDEVRSIVPGFHLHSFLESPQSTPPSPASITTSSPSDVCVPSADAPRRLPLHVSLTHPLPLRRSQIPDFLASIRRGLHASTSTGGASTSVTGKAFRLSLASECKAYHNGRRFGGEGKGGRAFLALRVGAGANELEDVVDKVIAPVLERLHLPAYHASPEFHTSIAWCLLHPDPSSTRPSRSRVEAIDTDTDLETPEAIDGPDLVTSASTTPGPTTTTTTSETADGSPFSSRVLELINKEFAPLVLAAQPVGGWRVDEICIKVAKTVHRVSLT